MGAILDLCYPSVILSFRNLSNEYFSSHFSQELWGLEAWNLVHTWAVGRCIVYNQAAAAYLSLYFFIFLSNFQTLKFIVTLFSGTVRPRIFKLGTHVDSGWMYRVYRNQAAAAYSSLYFFIFLSLVTLFSGTVRPRRFKLGTHVDSGWMYRVYRNQAAAAYLSLYFFFFFLSNFQTLNFSSHFLRNCEA